jgi:pyruvate dehydrogenase E1 component beta subunit
MISYEEAINEAIIQEMERDPSVFVYGIGVPDHKKIFGTTKDIVEKFGNQRCFDTPLSEDALTGFALGAAIGGLRPIYIHIRIDFMILCMNQIANVISSCRYLSNGRLKVPIVIRAIIGRGWGQGCQHSKSIHSVFAHFPGIKVVMPTTAYDAKGLLISSIRDDNPIVFIEHRWLYYQKGDVPVTPYTVPIGHPLLLQTGEDLTIVAVSWLNVEAKKAADILKRKANINVEIIDLRSISPIDIDIIEQSVNKTGRCIIADNDWTFCGVGSEIASQIYERCLSKLKCPIERVGFSNSPCPTARHLEDAFYPNAYTIIKSAEKIMKINPIDMDGESMYSFENKFKGPF